MAVIVASCVAPRRAHAADADAGWCERPSAGSSLPEPQALRSVDGVLELTLTLENRRGADGTLRYCYRSGDGSVSPTLRVWPGDTLVLKLQNRMTDLAPGAAAPGAAAPGAAAHRHPGMRRVNADPCSSGVMSATSTNLHFHGLEVPAGCHQDEVLKTSIAPGAAAFEYRIPIPRTQMAGLYWYHPHMHGFSAQQVGGGASGALIVEGLERSIPETGNLPERVIVIRDQALLHPQAAPTLPDAATTPFVDHDGDASNTGTGFGTPARDLSVNFVPVPYPDYPPATVAMRPGERQLWRVLNASSVTYLNLAMIWSRGHWRRTQFIGLVAVDGAPLNARDSPEPSFQWRDALLIPPGGRAEVMVNAPLDGTQAQLVTRFVDTGPAGENDPNRPLLTIVTQADAPEPSARTPAGSNLAAAPARPWLGSVTPARTRRLIFSERPVDPTDPAGPMEFFITPEGETPAVFDPHSDTVNLTTQQGDVEDWIIENRSSELHAFHIHQVHFEIVEWLGAKIDEPFLRDTINVPYFTPRMPRYPTIRLRMDFRDAAPGVFPYHCHLLDHEDGGMMGTLRVLPRAQADAPSVTAR